MYIYIYGNVKIGTFQQNFSHSNAPIVFLFAYKSSLFFALRNNAPALIFWGLAFSYKPIGILVIRWLPVPVPDLRSDHACLRYRN